MRKFLSLFALILSQPALAQDSSDGWSVGGVAFISQSIYVGESTNVFAFPAISYTKGKWEFGVNGITGTLHDEGASKVEFLIEPRFAEISDDTPELSGMDRRISGDVGARWSYEVVEDTTVEITARQDITDAHNGHELELLVERKVQIGPVPIWASAALTYQDSNLSNYLYGVDVSEARTGRPAYDPGAVLIPSVAFTTGYPLAEKAFLFGVLGYRAMPSAVTDSPIVARDSELSLTTGVAYSF